MCVCVVGCNIKELSQHRPAGQYKDQKVQTFAQLAQPKAMGLRHRPCLGLEPALLMRDQVCSVAARAHCAPSLGRGCATALCVLPPPSPGVGLGPIGDLLCHCIPFISMGLETR